MSNSAPDSSLIDKTTILVAFLITLALAALYAISVGIIAHWPDSLFYADRARHLLGEGRLALTAPTSFSYPPLYSLVMSLAFLMPDFLLSHQILICVQLFLMCSMFFPARGLLLGCEGIGKHQATILAVIIALLPTALPYANMLSAEALFIPLFVWFTYFYDKYLSADNCCAAKKAGILISLLVLTKDMGWVAYGAVLLNAIIMAIQNKQPIKHAFYLHVLPVLGAAIWLTYNILVLQQPFELPHWELNNGLARFNFFKNGLLYLFYGGMPLAGMVFFLSLFSKKVSGLQNAFYRFTFFVLLGALIYTVITNLVFIEDKLDYITNRKLEPFILLPFIAFLRLPMQSRKELSANAALIFFCLMLFGFPYALKTDFLTGISYWAQSLGNPNLGMLRNVIYGLLISLPIIIIWWQPKYFIPTYAFIAALIGFATIMQDKAVWSNSENTNFRFVNVAALTGNEDIKNASAVYIENQCNLLNSNDVSYLLRCNDLSKILYFIPRHLTAINAKALSGLSLKDKEHIIFASSQTSSVVGKPIAQIGLATLVRLEQSDLDALKTTPMVGIDSIEKLGRYINVPINHKLERLTLLSPDANFHINSDKAGCVIMHIRLAYAASDENGMQKKVNFILNKKSIKQSLFHAPIAGMDQPDFALPLQLAEGDNTLQLAYDNPAKQVDILQASMMMFGLPDFSPCTK